MKRYTLQSKDDSGLISMKYGVHLSLWAADPYFDLTSLIAKIAKMGFDGIEVMIAHLNESDMRILRNALEEYDLGCVGAVALDPDTDVSSSDEQIRLRGIEFLEKCAIKIAELGGGLISGVAYASWGSAPEARTEEGWRNSVESLKEVSRSIRGYGVTLGLEPLNRFKSYMLNTCDEAIKMVDTINEPNIGIHLDTFHMNMEEKNFYEPIKRAGHRLCHFHSAENDRGIPGTGHINWIEIYRGLFEIGYDGWNVLETFPPGVKGLSSFVGAWRWTFPDADTFASEGLRFLKKMEERIKLELK